MPAPVEVLDDINGELVNLYRVVQNHLEEFVRQFKWAISSRQVFKWQQRMVPETLTDIQRAARFYYLQHHAFGGKIWRPVPIRGNERMAARMRACKGKVMVSINDHPDIRRAFDGFPMLGLSIKCSVNNTTGAGPSTSREFVITNWEPGTQTGGLF